MLAPGGLLGVVDFYVSDARPPIGMACHGPLARGFWPWWFGHDGVRLTSAPLASLIALLDTAHLYEGLAAVPYLPALRVPYFIYVGRHR